MSAVTPIVLQNYFDERLRRSGWLTLELKLFVTHVSYYTDNFVDFTPTSLRDPCHFVQIVIFALG